jgi:predicted ATP-grasp superfamily ATP-dependent carboligase
VLRWAYDKRLIYRRAAELGIDQPLSYNPRSLDEVFWLDCRFPMVLKPAIKRTGSALEAAKAWRVDSRAELLARYAEACTQMDCEEILVQEVILASGNAQCSYGGLWAEGRPLASMTARCLRQFPVDFGCATYVRTVEEPEIEEISGNFLRGIGYTGLVEIEFKRDPRDGRYKMLDVNPRTWAWHSLSRRAGIDFPYLAWLQASDAPVPPARAQAGVAWVHMARDIIAAYLGIRRGRLSLAEYVRSLRGPLEFAAFAPDDPFPGCMDLPLLARRALGRATR